MFWIKAFSHFQKVVALCDILLLQLLAGKTRSPFVSVSKLVISFPHGLVFTIDTEHRYHFIASDEEVVFTNDIEFYRIKTL